MKWDDEHILTHFTFVVQISVLSVAMMKRSLIQLSFCNRLSGCRTVIALKSPSTLIIPCILKFWKICLLHRRLTNNAT